jgi:GntR family transcriptional repressor for pyruvate dehydrogenase complex
VIDPFERLQVKRLRLHEQIADSIQEIIAENDLQSGTRLPPERELAAHLEVSRATVSQAIRVLEQRGLVNMQAGSGTYVTDMARSVFIESMERLFTFSNSTFGDLVTFREMLEPSISALAAEHATPEELVVIKEFAEQTKEAFEEGDLDGCVAADAGFHTALAQATHNELVIAAATAIQSLLKSSMDAQVRVRRDPKGILSHWPIYDAVAAHDPERARAAMEEHMHLTCLAMQRVHKELSDMPQ